MSEEASDPFEEFAQRMKSTEETVKKVEEEEPAMPVKGIPDAEIIDRYGQFAEWVKQKKAAEQAMMKTKREFYDSLLEDVLERNGFPEKYQWPARGIAVGTPPIREGYLTGEEFKLGVAYPTKAIYSQDKLREIDLKHFVPVTGSLGVAMPPSGLSVKYSADPDAAAVTSVAEELNEAIDAFEAARKIKLTRTGSTT